MKNFIAYHKVSEFGEYETNSNEFVHYSGKSEKQLTKCINQRIWVISGRKLVNGTKYELVAFYSPSYIDKLEEGGFYIGGQGQGFSPSIDLTDTSWLQLLIKEQNNFSYGLNEIKDSKIVDGLYGLINGNVLNDEFYYPDEIKENIDSYLEGSKKQITVNIYERDKNARNACIEYYTAKCQVCEIDFESFYGEIGKGFIHVHHIIPISTIKETYRINPITDLVPVCPNCHSMLHKSNPPYSVEELKSKIKKSYASKVV